MTQIKKYGFGQGINDALYKYVNIREEPFFTSNESSKFRKLTVLYIYRGINTIFYISPSEIFMKIYDLKPTIKKSYTQIDIKMISKFRELEYKKKILNEIYQKLDTNFTETLNNKLKEMICHNLNYRNEFISSNEFNLLNIPLECDEMIKSNWSSTNDYMPTNELCFNNIPINVYNEMKIQENIINNVVDSNVIEVNMFKLFSQSYLEIVLTEIILYRYFCENKYQYEHLKEVLEYILNKDEIFYYVENDTLKTYKNENL